MHVLLAVAFLLAGPTWRRKCDCCVPDLGSGVVGFELNSCCYVFTAWSLWHVSVLLLHGWLPKPWFYCEGGAVHAQCMDSWVFTLLNSQLEFPCA